MTWVPLLLADQSPCLRLLVLKELLHRQVNDSEIQELMQLRDSDPLITDLISLQTKDGSWSKPYADKVLTTSFSLIRLGYLGFDLNHPVVKKGAEFIFSKQQENGAWSLPAFKEKKEEDESYSNVPLQVAIPLRALASCGYATDPRSENAYKWLIDRRLNDGAWPVGLKAGRPGFIAGYRKLPHSRWGCRTNTTASLTCLSLHPELRNSKETRRALDLLLGRETKERHTLGFEIARVIGVEPWRGYFTFHARFDIAFILDLCWKIGADRDDDRVNNLIDFILKQQGRYGLWDYIPHPQVSRWVSFDLLRSLSHLDKSTDWVSLEPRTPFQSYPKKQKRY